MDLFRAPDFLAFPTIFVFLILFHFLVFQVCCLISVVFRGVKAGTVDDVRVRFLDRHFTDVALRELLLVLPLFSVLLLFSGHC